MKLQLSYSNIKFPITSGKYNFSGDYILFPETRAIAGARAGTDANKLTYAIYCTREIVVFSLCFVIIVYFPQGETFH